MLEQLLSDFKTNLPQFLNSGCIVNGTVLELGKIEEMGYEEFSYQCRLHMPKKFYKYFPNKGFTTDNGIVQNYSIQALKDNTVYMQSPNNFDDFYDSDIYVDYEKYEKLRLIEYCRRCNITIEEKETINEIGNAFLKEIEKSLNKNKCYDYIFSKAPDSEFEKLENELICKSLFFEMQNTSDLGKAVSKIICQEYSDFMEEIKNTFRISCFTTTPYSQLMWGGVYSDCHRGFCLEYTVLPNDEKYKDIFYNLFPMIYCKTRTDITNELIAARGKNLSIQDLWNIYFHGALRKSMDWAFQNEWRLLLPLGRNAENYNIKFYPITKVFLGSRMPDDKRMQIIDICKELNIPYVCVRKNPLLFEMQDCNMNCEKCFYNSKHFS